MDHLSLEQVQADPGPCRAPAPGSAVTLCAYQKVMTWSMYVALSNTTNRVSTMKIEESNVAGLRSLFRGAPVKQSSCQRGHCHEQPSRVSQAMHLGPGMLASLQL